MRCTCCRRFRPIECFPWLKGKMPVWRQRVCKDCTLKVDSENDTKETGAFRTFGLADFFRPKPPNP